MTQYHDMTALERFVALDQTAAEFFRSPRWKAAFCRRYGLTPQTLTAWKDKGAPVWACVAIGDALAASKLTTIHEAIQKVEP